MLKRWLSLYGASVYTGLSESQLRRAFKSGKCPASKEAGRWLVPVENLDAWLEKGMTKEPEAVDQMPRTPKSEAAALRALVRE